MDQFEIDSKVDKQTRVSSELHADMSTPSRTRSGFFSSLFGQASSSPKSGAEKYTLANLRYGAEHDLWTR